MNKVVLKGNDYYPFGMLVPNRNYSSPSYRYGFNGMEADDELKGSKNSYTAEFWEYDPKIIRKWNIDPVVKGYESPYVPFRNNPILFTDTDGLNGIATIDKKTKKLR